MPPTFNPATSGLVPPTSPCATPFTFVEFATYVVYAGIESWMMTLVASCDPSFVTVIV